MVEEPIDRARRIEQTLHDKYAVPNTMVVELEAVIDKNARQEERMVADNLAQALEGLIKVAGVYCEDCDVIIYDIGHHNADHSFNSTGKVAEAREVLRGYRRRIW